MVLLHSIKIQQALGSRMRRDIPRRHRYTVDSSSEAALISIFRKGGSMVGTGMIWTGS